jgi:hypothetical protein
VVTLNGADYVTIDSLNIDATNGGSPGTYGWGVLLTGQADNNRISNSTITTNTTSTSTNFAGVIVSGSLTAATTAGASASNFTLEGNTIRGGYYGVTVVGTSATALATGNVVRNNVVRDFYFYGIYSTYNQGLLVSGNDVNRATRTAGFSTFYGIYMSTGSTNVTVEKNRIHDPFTGSRTSTSAAYGIYLTGADGTAAAPNTIANNALYNFNGSGVVYGFYNSSSDHSRYYYNTVIVDTAAAASSSLTRGFYQTTVATGIDLKNNIISITRGGTGAQHALYFATATTTFTSNYNDLYAPNGSVGYLTSARATLADWRTATSGDANSVSVNPQVVSTATGVLQPLNLALNNTGTPIAGITTDILGTTRSTTTPDIGAYEFAPVSVDVASQALLSPSASTACYGAAETITVQIRNNAATAVDFGTYAATVTVVVTPPSGTAQTFTTTVNTGTLAAGATQSVTLPGTLNMSALGTYSFAITTSTLSDTNTANDVLTPAPTRTVQVAAPVATFSYPLGLYCAGLTSSISPTLGAGATAGTFSSTAGLTLNATTGAINLASSTAGTYTITNTIAASSSCPAITATATFTVRATPAAPTLTAQLQPNGSVLLTSSSASNNQFYFNGSPVGGIVTGNTLTLTSTTQNGTYTVYTTQNGCTSPVSNTVSVTVTSARQGALAGTELLVYPNPTSSGQLTLELRGYRQAAELTVFDAVGKLVHTQHLSAARTGTAAAAEVNLTALPAGVYTLRVTSAGGVDTRRVVRQ